MAQFLAGQIVAPIHLVKLDRLRHSRAGGLLPNPCNPNKSRLVGSLPLHIAVAHRIEVGNSGIGLRNRPLSDVDTSGLSCSFGAAGIWSSQKGNTLRCGTSAEAELNFVNQSSGDGSPGMKREGTMP